MINTLFIKAFIKAEKEVESKKLTHKSKYLSDFIFNDSNIQYGEKSLRDKLNEIKKDENVKIELKSYVKESLSHFLGYSNYEEFKKDNKSNNVKITDIKNPNAIVDYIKKNKTVIIPSTLVIISIVLFISINKQKWMIWTEEVSNEEYIGEYKEASFDTKELTNGKLKYYKKERILNFKQIIPNCKTKFFNEDGRENLWYGKNIKGELEYFTALGLHPETGKTLKKITPYMINKYICQTD